MYLKFQTTAPHHITKHPLASKKYYKGHASVLIKLYDQRKEHIATIPKAQSNPTRCFTSGLTNVRIRPKKNCWDQSKHITYPNWPFVLALHFTSIRFCHNLYSLWCGFVSETAAQSVSRRNSVCCDVDNKQHTDRMGCGGGGSGKSTKKPHPLPSKYAPSQSPPFPSIWLFQIWREYIFLLLIVPNFYCPCAAHNTPKFMCAPHKRTHR